jgi:hypothetical protein
LKKREGGERGSRERERGGERVLPRAGIPPAVEDIVGPVNCRRGKATTEREVETLRLLSAKKRRGKRNTERVREREREKKEERERKGRTEKRGI